MYCEDENELQTEINSVTNKEILDLVKNKKKKKKTYSENFEAEEPSDSQYEVGRKYRKKNVNNEDKVINENCDGKSWDNIIDNIDMSEVNNKKKKKKRRIGSENLDESINAYSRDNNEEQREQFHNASKCSNSEINELHRQKSDVVDIFEMSKNCSKKKKKKRMIKDKFANDNTQPDSNCNDGIQVEMVSSTNGKILHDGFMKKNKESHCKKLDIAVDLCNAEMCNELTKLNKKKKKNTEVIDCQDSKLQKNNSNQVKTKKRKLKNIYSDYDITELHKDMSETKRTRIQSEELDASVSLSNIKNSVEPTEKCTNISDESMEPKEDICEFNSYCTDNLKKKLKRRREERKYSVESIESKERNGIEDKCALNDYSGEHKKKKKKRKQHISKDEESLPCREMEMADISDVAPASKKRRSLSKFAQQFKMKNKKRKDVTVETELPYLEDYFCIEDLNINIPFPVHPLHTYCRRPSRPRPEEIAAAQGANLKIKSGFFTEAEDNKIRENWQAFCKEHRLNVDPSHFFHFPRKMKMEEKLKFLQYLGHGLEDRLLYRVHYRFKKIFQNPVMKQGRFTKKEDEQILMYLTSTQSKRPFKDLAQILNRTNLSIEKRYDYLSSSQKPRIKWTIDVVDQLVNHMLKITKSEDIDSLRNVKFTSKQWLKLSKKMGYMSVRRIQRAWKVYIYPRLFSNDYVDLVKMKKKIIKILYKRNETDWRSVNWEEIAAKFEGFTAQKIYMMFKQTVNFHAPSEVSKNLKDCVDYMKNIFLKESKLHSTHKFDKFIYKDGHVQYKRIDSCNNLE